MGDIKSACMMSSELGFRSGKSNHDLLKNHIQLQSESAENFITLVDLQILIKVCKEKSYETRMSTQEDFASPLVLPS